MTDYPNIKATEDIARGVIAVFGLGAALVGYLGIRAYVRSFGKDV